MKMTVNEIAQILKAQLVGEGGAEVTGVNQFESANAEQLTFASDAKLLEKISTCKAAAVITKNKVESPVPLLIVDNVEKTLIEAMKLFLPKIDKPAAGIHKSAVVEDGAVIDPTASIGPLTVISKGAKIGAGTVIAAGCKIGQDVIIGKDCKLDENVVVYYRCTIGNCCFISAGAVIGATGFGYYFIDGQHRLIPHTGGVIIEDCVEIGANSCVDRAKFGNTIIGAGSKIDNLVQVAHNVVVGKCCILVSQVGIAGSCKLGNGVILGGQVGLKDHITIGDMTQVGAQAGVMTDIGPNERVAGSPAIDIKEKARQVLIEQKLPEMNKQLKQLLKKVEQLEASKDNSK
jgi:UDP-3-O-[3-hydroxymyristoyl] glucosamine N-acyltransferase